MLVLSPRSVLLLLLACSSLASADNCADYVDNSGAATGGDGGWYTCTGDACVVDDVRPLSSPPFVLYSEGWKGRAPADDFWSAAPAVSRGRKHSKTALSSLQSPSHPARASRSGKYALRLLLRVPSAGPAARSTRISRRARASFSCASLRLTRVLPSCAVRVLWDGPHVYQRPKRHDVAPKGTQTLGLPPLGRCLFALRCCVRACTATPPRHAPPGLAPPECHAPLPDAVCCFLCCCLCFLLVLPAACGSSSVGSCRVSSRLETTSSALSRR